MRLSSYPEHLIHEHGEMCSPSQDTIIDDIVNSIYDNADKELGSVLLTKTEGYAGGFYSQSIPLQESLDVMCAEGFSYKGFLISVGIINIC